MALGRSVSIHSGWPNDEKLSAECDSQTLHLSREGWVVFVHEGETKTAGLLTQSWDSAVDYARRWMMGETIEELERNTK